MAEEKKSKKKSHKTDDAEESNSTSGFMIKPEAVTPKLDTSKYSCFDR
jgi:hypothetical protein